MRPGPAHSHAQSEQLIRNLLYAEALHVLHYLILMLVFRFRVVAVVDAAGKLGANFLNGDTSGLGSYSECTVRGFVRDVQYCFSVGSLYSLLRCSTVFQEIAANGTLSAPHYCMSTHVLGLDADPSISISMPWCDCSVV
jgi:hypothetical protein